MLPDNIDIKYTDDSALAFYRQSDGTYLMVAFTDLFRTQAQTIISERQAVLGIANALTNPQFARLEVFSN